jgi:transcriptional regulator with XRE-family HTH domain
MNETVKWEDKSILAALGRRVANTRIHLELTQAELAARAGVAKRTIERLECGQVATQLLGFIRVCRALGLLERIAAILPEAKPGSLTPMKQKTPQRRRASSRRRTSPTH